MWKLIVLVIVFSPHKSEQLISLKDFNNFELANFNLVGESHMNFSRYYFKDYLQLLSDEKFVFNRKTLLYAHGWIEDFYSESTMTVVEAYIKRGDHNIIVLDWGQYSFGEYFSVIPRFTQISKMLAKILIDMFERGLDINQLHCVGHSFASHIFGIAGRELYKNSYGKYKLKRITGLDPAHFGFFPPLLEKPLSSNDAVFVDAIHTDVNFIGTTNRVGHVDFYPNDGQLQPGCPPFRFDSFMDIVNSFCSHQHAWRYWSETAKPNQQNIFPAVRCKSYKSFQNGKCNKNKINFMGLAANASIPGVFYNQLHSNRDYIVDQSYYTYLATSLSYRSDLPKIIARLQQFLKILTKNRKK